MGPEEWVRVDEEGADPLDVDLMYSTVQKSSVQVYKAGYHDIYRSSGPVKYSTVQYRCTEPIITVKYLYSLSHLFATDPVAHRLGVGLGLLKLSPKLGNILGHNY